MESNLHIEGLVGRLDKQEVLPVDGSNPVHTFGLLMVHDQVEAQRMLVRREGPMTAALRV